MTNEEKVSILDEVQRDVAALVEITEVLKEVSKAQHETEVEKAVRKEREACADVVHQWVELFGKRTGADNAYRRQAAFLIEEDLRNRSA